MNALAEFTADFPWGVLLVTDANSTEQIPEWASPADTVTAAESALVVRIRHGDEGSAMIRVIDTQSDAVGENVFDGTLQVRSGVLRISDALGHRRVDVDVVPGPVRLRVYADDRFAATAIDVVLG